MNKILKINLIKKLKIKDWFNVIVGSYLLLKLLKNVVKIIKTINQSFYKQNPNNNKKKKKLMKQFQTNKQNHSFILFIQVFMNT